MNTQFVNNQLAQMPVEILGKFANAAFNGISLPIFNCIAVDETER
ncbi:hypothetical protein EV586_107137 [Tumebacillus sp. BK434]|nr:hypothetical protein EV586_107137 [Tumebacillus sp. BK434]